MIETFTILVVVQNGIVTMENRIMGPEKLNIKLPYDLAFPLLSLYPKELKQASERDFSTPIFIKA